MPPAPLASSFPLLAPASCLVTPPSFRSGADQPAFRGAETPEGYPHLRSFLEQVPDPRSRQGRRYPLPLLLVLVLTALCTGCQGYLSAARWARGLRAEDQQALGFAPRRTPCASTLLNLFRVLDWDELARQLHRWVEATGLPLPEPPLQEPGVPGEAPEPVWLGLALDGKTLRGSLAAGASVAHLVGLVAHGLGIHLTEVGVEAKQGELTVAPEVLAPVLAPGRVITGDALFTQRTLCEQILAGDSEYVLPVKGNQPTLLQAVQAVLAALPKAEREAQQRRSTWTVEQGHGRIENRFLLLATVSPGQVEWPGVAQVFALERRQHHPARGGRPASHHRELVYGITSLQRKEAGPETVLRLQRGHWSVENQVHWVLDTFFREDERRIRDGKVARGMAALRRGALNLLRRFGARSIPEAADGVKANPLRILSTIGVLAEN